MWKHWLVTFPCVTALHLSDPVPYDPVYGSAEFFDALFHVLCADTIPSAPHVTSLSEDEHSKSGTKSSAYLPDLNRLRLQGIVLNAKFLLKCSWLRSLYPYGCLRSPKAPQPAVSPLTIDLFKNWGLYIDKEDFETQEPLLNAPWIDLAKRVQELELLDDEDI